MSTAGRFEVVIAGGGPAAIEAALRLRRLAEGRIATTILAPDERFLARPLSVLVPFGLELTPYEPLADLARTAGATLRPGRLAAVDTAGRRAITETGASLAYDALLVAIGAADDPPPAYQIAFGSPGTEEPMRRLVQDIEGGYARRVAFLVPAGATWPLPIYELALMAAARAAEMGRSPQLELITPEPAPLELFGPEGARAVAAQLEQAGIRLRAGEHARVPRHGLVELHPGGDRLDFDRVVTLATVHGPGVVGLPHDGRGYLTVDRHGRLANVPGIYAAGDVTSFPVKQGGLACRQADAAAEAIAAQAGVAIDPEPFTAVLEGVLLTEHGTTFLRRDAGGAAGDDSAASVQPLWWPPAKIAGRELSRVVRDLSHGARPAGSVAVRLPLAGP